MAKRKFDPIIICDDDNLYIDEVRSWSEDKYSLLGGYCDIFTSGMKNKWDNLVYIDMFAGSGYARFKETRKIVKSSPLIALSIPNKFDKYIFCDIEEAKLSALKDRVELYYPYINTAYVVGDCNDKVDELLNEIPIPSTNNTVLTFCFADPYSLNLKFNTIKKLSKNGNQRIDFLILLALHMDANRNFIYYINENNNKIANFLDDDRWKSEFVDSSLTENNFVQYLYNKYNENFKNLGYVKPENPFQIRSTDNNLPLYYLAFYSKHKRGNDFYKKIQKYSTKQGSLGF